MDQDLKCLMETFGPCCTRSWLSLPYDDLGSTPSILQLCGHNETLQQREFTINNPGKSIHIKFHSVGNQNMRRGFQLHYTFSKYLLLSFSHLFWMVFYLSLSYIQIHDKE